MDPFNIKTGTLPRWRYIKNKKKPYPSALVLDEVEEVLVGEAGQALRDLQQLVLHVVVLTELRQPIYIYI